MNSQGTSTWGARVATAAVCAGLAACGGGGDGEGSDHGTVALAVANRDVSAHAVAGGAIGLGGADRALPAAATMATMAARGRARALAMRPTAVGDTPSDCAISGTVTEIDDDRDHNGTPSVGDVITITFDQCRDSDDSMVDGTVQLTITSVDSSAVDMRMTATALVSDTGPATDPPAAHHRTRIDGTMAARSVLSGTSQFRTTLTAQGAVRVTLHTPVFDDTVDLLDGFVQQVDEDLAGGLVRARHAGMLGSQAAGGTLSVTTPAPFVYGGSDRFPRSGVLHARGRTGELRINAVSSTTVQVDLDANDDGTFEDTTQQAWDWLI